MNSWDYHILKNVGLYLAVFGPVIYGFWIIIQFIREECFWAKYPFKALKDLIFGKRYIVKINGVWSVCRGRLSKNEYYLNVKYGKGKHKWELESDEFESIKRHLSDKDIYEKVVEKNICDLKKKHPKKKRKINGFIITT